MTKPLADNPVMDPAAAVNLRSPTQRHLFTVAPLDVLVTRDEATGQATFHIIEINGTGIAGITNMPDRVVATVMQSFSELPAQLQHIPHPVVLVASSGQESSPPVSRTMHEKMLYVEALRRGFESLGRPVHVTNMTRLEKEPAHMPATGAVVILGYMKQFRKHLQLSANGQLLLQGRQVHVAINDRFVLNIMHQFDHKVDLTQFMGHNQCFTAGADKGVAYTLYNEFFSGPAAGVYPTMASAMNFTRAHSREQLVKAVQCWLSNQHRPVVIKPQGTGCGHGIEFFFQEQPEDAVCAKVDASLASVTKNYALACGGLPFTVCEYLDTASVSDAAAKAHDGVCLEAQQEPHHMTGHKFELRIVVYRDGDVLKAYPSIAKVAREAFDPDNPDKSSLINNIST
ncbi:uncharacterized protein HaLaN_22816 [Haematococcus lacustris]|uniref:ATP-grasp domain-containing protein n=1 Tax=Haematococcus lacustris TaxID=44745 RepID=A0A6A0A0K4_HAELA|nr:uncharacterized protein HaLaN_22816 [Haematococcus lacustris]